MKMLLALTLLSLAFATGFTCSKQQPAEETAAPAAQEEMADPAAAPAETAPTEEAAPAPTEAPAEGASH
ncbi:MAG: acylneuraminate cytidylyltransferase [Bdellovibrionaceae bacterium]|nr:acylneuraminate cytidylyltransferase [Pseudobdellovibrionaceae bacterium]